MQLPELELALMSLRFTFGGAPGPYKWSIISETVCNFTTAIKPNDNWDPLTLYGINQHLVPPPKYLDDLIPFAEGLELIVEIQRLHQRPHISDSGRRRDGQYCSMQSHPPPSF